MTLEELQVVIKAKTEGLRNELNKVAAKVKSVGNQIKGTTDNIENNFKKIHPDINTEKLKTKIKNVEATLDNTNAQIEKQQAKLSELKESYKMAFSDDAKNSIEEKILKTEAAINRLTGKSDKLGFELADLDAKLSSTGSSAEKAGNGLKDLGNKAEQAGNKARQAAAKTSDLNSKIKNTNNSTNVASKGMKSYGYGISSVMRQMMLWMLILPTIASGIKSLGEGLLNNLKTNNEFSTSLAQIKSNLMIAFTPIYYAILPAINALMHGLSVVTQYIASFISAIFGKTFNQSKQATQQLIDAKQAMGAYGSSAKKAGKDTKKAGEDARKGLMGFDEINTLGSNKNDSGDDGGGAGSGVPQLVTPALETAPIDSSMKNLIDRIKKYAGEIASIFKKGFDDGFGSVDWNVIKSEINSIGKSLKDIFTDKKVVDAAQNWGKSLIYNLGKVTGSVASVGVSIGDNLLGGVSRYLANNTPRIKDYLVNMFDIQSDVFNIIGNFTSSVAQIFTSLRSDVAKNVTSNIIGIIVDTFMGANEIFLKLGRDALNIITSPFIDNADGFKQAVTNTLSGINEVLDGIKSTVDLFFDDINKMYDEHLKPFFDNIANGISTIVGDLVDFYNAYLAPIIQAIGEDINEFLKNNFSPVMNDVIDIIGNIIDILNSIWKNVIAPLISWIISNVLPVLSPILNTIWDIAKTLFANLFDIIGGLVKIIKGITDFLAGVFTRDWSRAWQGIVSIFGGIFSGLGAIIKAPLNAVIGIINGAISGINSISIDIPDWVPGLGGKHFGTHLSRIPYLAKGGIVDQPTLAVVGEAGKEAVMPLENNTGWISNLAGQIVSQLPQGTGGDNKQPITLQLYVGTKKVAEEIIEDINKVTKSTGVCPIKI